MTGLLCSAYKGHICQFERIADYRMMALRSIPTLFCFALALLWVSPLAAQDTEGAVEKGRYGQWIVHQSASNDPQICFAASQPQTKEPAGANRSAIVFYVSAWPKDGIKSEVSIKLGYPIRPDSPVAVTVGSDEFQLFAKDDRAFVADATDELKLIEAMKKGATLVVSATSTRGTRTTDTYSLQGVTRALQEMASACP